MNHAHGFKKILAPLMRIVSADLHRENMKMKRRELEQASIDAASDLLDTDSNATFAMVSSVPQSLVYRKLAWNRFT